MITIVGDMNTYRIPVPLLSTPYYHPLNVFDVGGRNKIPSESSTHLSDLYGGESNGDQPPVLTTESAE